MLETKQKEIIEKVVENHFPEDVATNYYKAAEIKIHTDSLDSNQILAIADAMNKASIDAEIRRSGAGITVIFSPLN